MTSPVLRNILHELVHRLDQDGHLELTTGASLEGLRDELIANLQDQPSMAQLHTWLVGSLVRSPNVEELFISDDELRDILRSLAP